MPLLPSLTSLPPRARPPQMPVYITSHQQENRPCSPELPSRLLSTPSPPPEPPRLPRTPTLENPEGSNQWLYQFRTRYEFAHPLQHCVTVIRFEGHTHDDMNYWFVLLSEIGSWNELACPAWRVKLYESNNAQANQVRVGEKRFFSFEQVRAMW